MAQRVNESVYKAVEKAWAEEMHKKIEEQVTAKLSIQFNNEWLRKK